MAEGYVVKAVPFVPDMAKLAARVHLAPEQRPELEKMVEQAAAVACPKAFYRESFIEKREEALVVVDGIGFNSRLLKTNLEQTYRVFPYVATCGLELMEWAKSFNEDPLQQYWADVIMESALREATRALEQDVQARFSPGKTATMNPGSLPDWPLSEQKQLFSLLGDAERTVGVRLTEDYLMIPLKSVSGIIFPTKTDYNNCRLCRRENCPGRRAPFDPELYASRLG